MVGSLLARKVSFGEAISVFSSIPLSAVAPILLLSCLWFIARVARWGYLLRSCAVPASRTATVFSFGRGLIMGIATPLQLGELARATCIREGYRGAASILVIVDKVFDLAALGILASIGIGIHASRPLLGMLGAVLVGILLGFGARLAMMSTHLLARVGWFSEERIRDVRVRLLSVVENRGVSSLLLLLSLLAYLVVVAQYYLILGLLAPGYDKGALIVCPAIILARAMPFTFSGLGVRESVALALFPKFGVPGTAAVAVSLAMFVINAWIPLIFSIISLLPRREQAK